jgi:hypothetical protein
MELALIRRPGGHHDAGERVRSLPVRSLLWSLLIHLEGRMSRRAANVAWRCTACGNIVATGRPINRIASLVRQ